MTPPPLAQPTRAFDPWNSSSTGHQRAEARGPRGWRESRNAKLQSQFLAGRSGGPRMSDTVGTGAATYDATLNALVTPEAKARAVNSVADMLRNPGTMKPAPPPPEPNAAAAEPRKIFSGLTIYINGLTGSASYLSDHRLKQDLVQNGAKISLHLARQKVTHVIVGRPAAGPSVGAGGGLAAGKLEREITRMRKSGVKFVAAEWATESIAAGRRLPESRFANLKVAASAQPSVRRAFADVEASGSGGGE